MRDVSTRRRLAAEGIRPTCSWALCFAHGALLATWCAETMSMEALLESTRTTVTHSTRIDAEVDFARRGTTGAG